MMLKTFLDHLAWLGLHLSIPKKFQLPIFGSFSRAWERGWGHLGGLGDSLYHLAGFTAKLYGSQKLFWNCRGSVRSNSLAGDATSDLKISLMERSEHRVKQLQKCWNSNSRSQRIPGDLNFASSVLPLLSQEEVANRSQIYWGQIFIVNIPFTWSWKFQTFVGSLSSEHDNSFLYIFAINESF